MADRPHPESGGAAAIRRLNPWLVAAFVLAALVTLVFAVRTIVGVASWHPPENEPIRSWMTVGYIGRSWDLDPRRIDAVAGLPLPVNRPLTLAEIATQRDVPVETVIAEVEAAIAAIRAEDAGQQPPEPPPPPAQPPAPPGPPGGPAR